MANFPCFHKVMAHSRDRLTQNKRGRVEERSAMNATEEGGVEDQRQKKKDEKIKKKSKLL